MTQIIIAGILSFLVAIFTTPMLVRYFSGVGKGQEIREDGPQLHLRKRAAVLGDYDPDAAAEGDSEGEDDEEKSED